MNVSLRRRLPRIAAVLAAVLAPGWLVAAPLDSVRDCAATASPALSGIKDLNEACPQLEDALRSLGLDVELYDGWRQQLNRDALHDLWSLSERYRGSKPQASADVGVLPGILESLAREQTPIPKSWWDAFRAWLRTWFVHHDPESLSWLDRWLERFGQSITLLNAILYALMALVLIAAAAVIVNELKAAGPLRRGRDAAASAAGEANPDAAAPEVAGSESMTPADRLAMLLQLLVNRLVQTGRLRAERSLTHRELVVRSRFDSESQRLLFATVANTAETLLYGSESAAPEQLGSVLQQGQTLLRQLSGSSSAP